MGICARDALGPSMESICSMDRLKERSEDLVHGAYTSKYFCNFRYLLHICSSKEKLERYPRSSIYKNKNVIPSGIDYCAEEWLSG